MQLRPLGITDVSIPAVAFGAGPVPGLLTDPAAAEAQRAAVRAALDAGINWFDTGATYGDGRSEAALGAALAALGVADRVHVATKVRLDLDGRDDIADQVRASVDESLRRLGLERVTLLQLHNSVTARRGDLPTSVTPADVLGPGGVLESFAEQRRAGRVAHFGLTALGEPDALREVLASRAFAAAQVPCNLLTARRRGGAIDDGDVVSACVENGVAVLAIRVLAGGALARQPPSAHTQRTIFFPLELYEADRARAERLAARLPPGMTLPEAAVRFALGRPAVTAALIGFASAEQVADAARWAAAGPLPGDVIDALLDAGD